MTRCRIRVLLGLLLAVLVVRPSFAGDIVTEWSAVKTPPPPSLQPVKLDSSDTALLLLDFDTKICNADKRPRCFATLPGVAALLANARSHGVMVAYSTVMTGSVADVPAPLAPRPGDPVVRSGVDKFLGTDLGDILKARNIHTVIVVGTSAHGAALYTASGAALRGFKVVVPVDGMSADDPFAELAAAWILQNAPQSVSGHVTLTRMDMIGF